MAMRLRKLLSVWDAFHGIDTPPTCCVYFSQYDFSTISNMKSKYVSNMIRVRQICQVECLSGSTCPGIAFEDYQDGAGLPWIYTRRDTHGGGELGSFTQERSVS